MSFNFFMFQMLDLVNKSDKVNITLALQKGRIIDILVSVCDDVIVDTSVDIHSFTEAEERKMTKIINAINEYC